MFQIHKQNFKREGNEEEPEDDELTDEIDNIDPLAFAEFTSLNGWDELPLDNFTATEIR